jgi:hypothetical protein
MMKYTVEWHDKMHRWDVVRWTDTVEGARVGTTVDRCFVLEQAQEICDYHNDMMNPELWADVGCEFDQEIAV